MTRLIDHRWSVTGNPNSRVRFEAEPNSWSRFLLLDGKPAYLTGGGCDTCSFLFERMDGAVDRVDVKDASETLKLGICSLSDPIVEQAANGVPPDEYLVFLADFVTRLVRPGDQSDYFCQEQIELWGLDPFWGLPHNPKVSYYRGEDRELGEAAKLFEFVIPMFPDNWLDSGAIRKYHDDFTSNNHPTAVVLSVLDVRSPVEAIDKKNRAKISEHWCLAHYVLDGHHKIFASVQAGRPVRVLGFLSLSQGMSTRDQLARVVS